MMLKITFTSVLLFSVFGCGNYKQVVSGITGRIYSNSTYNIKSSSNDYTNVKKTGIIENYNFGVKSALTLDLGKKYADSFQYLLSINSSSNVNNWFYTLKTGSELIDRLNQLYLAAESGGCLNKDNEKLTNDIQRLIYYTFARQFILNKLDNWQYKALSDSSLALTFRDSINNLNNSISDCI